jgi:hypothetical protein
MIEHFTGPGVRVNRKGEFWNLYGTPQVQGSHSTHWKHWSDLEDGFSTFVYQARNFRTKLSVR